MVKRIWHGWTSHENASAYQELLNREIFPGIEAKGIAGYRGIELLRRDRENEVEFVTLMTFDSLESVKGFHGEDYQRCYVPEAARKLLARWDRTSEHFEIKEVRHYE